MRQSSVTQHVAVMNPKREPNNVNIRQHRARYRRHPETDRHTLAIENVSQRQRRNAMRKYRRHLATP
jgi:hypothetical protein